MGWFGHGLLLIIKESYDQYFRTFCILNKWLYFDQLAGLRVVLSKSLRSLYDIMPFRSELLLIDILDASILIFEAVYWTAFLKLFSSFIVYFFLYSFLLPTKLLFYSITTGWLSFSLGGGLAFIYYFYLVMFCSLLIEDCACVWVTSLVSTTVFYDWLSFSFWSCCSSKAK